MRVAELSRRSATTVPTIKFYLREGLLPPGEATGRNQAEYDEAHVRRLRLIRALLDVGGLSVAAAREVLSVVDTPGVPDHELLGAASFTITRARPSGGPETNRGRPELAEAQAEVLAFHAVLGYTVEETANALGAPIDTIRSRLRNGLAKLRARVANDAELLAAIEGGT